MFCHGALCTLLQAQRLPSSLPSLLVVREHCFRCLVLLSALSVVFCVMVLHAVFLREDCCVLLLFALCGMCCVMVRCVYGGLMCVCLQESTLHLVLRLRGSPSSEAPGTKVCVCFPFLFSSSSNNFDFLRLLLLLLFLLFFFFFFLFLTVFS